MENINQPVNAETNDFNPRKPTIGLYLSLGLNVVLLIVLLVFVYFFFRTPQQPQTPVMPQLFSDTTNQGLRIAFVNSDSIMANYDLVKDMHKRMEASSKKKESDLKNRQKAFEEKVSDFQSKVSSNAISMDIAQITEKQLMQEQQQLIDLRDKLTDELAMEEYELNMQLLDSVSNFIIRFNQQAGFHAVLNYKHGSTAFLVDPALDITKIVVDQLNAEYRLRKTAKKK